MKHLICFIALLALVAAAAAQTSTTGQIAGVVTDNTGALVVGAQVTLNSANGQHRTATTDGSGYYRFPQLEPGTYDISFNASGFSEITRSAVTVLVTQTTTISPTLAAGGTVTTVQVTTQAPLVDATTATNGRVIEEREVRGLPLPTRNFQQLLTLSAGTSASVSNNTSLGRGDSNVSVNGQQATSNNVQIDGIQVNSIGTNSTPNLAVPSPDAIREFIVQTSLYDATQGRNTGGNVAVVTRSGVNRIHGSAFEFFRNEALNANDFFLKRSGQPRPELRRNQFGATLGGPLWKDKTFLFVAYQGQRERNGASVVNSISFLNIPTGLTSDRSTATLKGYAASLGVPVVNTAALGMLQAKLPNGQYAIPNASTRGIQSCNGALCVAQTALSGLSKYDENQFNINLDQNFGEKDRASARYFSSNAPSVQAINTFLGANPYQAPGYGGVLYFRNRVLSLNETHLFSSNLLNDFHAGFSRIKGYSHPQEPFTNAQFGINNPLAGQFPGLATIQVNGLFTVGSGPLVDQHSVTGTFQFADMLTWTHGRQTIRVGGDVFRHRVDFLFNFFSRGELLVNSFQQFLGGGSATAPVTGLLGNGVRDRGYRSTDGDAFFQDDIRVSSSLTVNAGLRFQRFGGFSDIRGRLVNFDPSVFLANHSAACTRTAPCDVPNNGFTMLHGNQALNADQYNVAPRIGFSFKPGGRANLVVRGGYGMYFDRFSSRVANLQIFNYPYDIVGVGLGSLQTSFPNLANLTFPLAPIVPSPIPFYFFGAPLPGTQTPISGLYVDKNFKSPYVQQYNLGVQYEPFRNYMIEIGYVGTKGTRLINVATLGQTNAPPVILGSGFSTNKALNGFDLAQSTAASNYNSLQATLTKRFDKHLQFLAAYTYAKALDNNSGALENELVALPGDQNNLATQYGASDYDRTQRFVLSGVYDMGKVYKGGSWLLAEAANGWGATTIATFQGGTPFSVTCIVGSALYNRADLVAGVSPHVGGSTESKLGRYFNTAAFKPGCTNTAPYGTSPRNLLRGPGQKNIDFGVVKHLSVSELADVEFRSEFFNIFNFANFANPNTNMAALGAGTISATSAGPRVIQFALKASF